MTSSDSAWAGLTGLYPVFDSLPRDDMALLRSTLIWADLPSGQTVFHEGQACIGFPLLVSGCIRVAKIGENGREIALYRVRAGGACIVSTSCLLGARNYNAFGVAEAPSRLALIPSGRFEDMLHHRDFRRFVFGLFAQRMVSLMTMVEALAFQRLDQRLAVRLLENGPEWRISQQALAADLGSVREIIGRTLKGFALNGLVMLERGRIKVVDADRLGRVARGEGVAPTPADIATEKGA